MLTKILDSDVRRNVNFMGLNHSSNDSYPNRAQEFSEEMVEFHRLSGY